ncbi:hypothetical protein ACN4EK_14540 [Pantanalinema rosaneae CENA516]|uniref:hypothetical protein n=1 Tax=Pantanalinema rosaneae TaxID=1620701 RepID=UPI003D6FC7F6
MNLMQRLAIAACGFLTTGALIEVGLSGQIMQPVAARVGRPLTPVSAAGVSRRTTRRVIRRSTVYVASLPSSCSTVIIEGTSLYSCSGTYYQPYGTQYVVVYVD